MELAAHPMWSDDPEDLATAIYYTVLAKSGDKRGWKWESTDLRSDGGFMARFYDARQPGVTVSQARQTASTTRHQSDWDLLFEAIDKVVERQGPTRPADPRCVFWPVHKKHLEILRAGLESMGRKGIPQHLPVEFYARLLNRRISSRAYPQIVDIVPLREHAQHRAHANRRFWEFAYGGQVYDVVTAADQSKPKM